MGNEKARPWVCESSAARTPRVGSPDPLARSALKASGGPFLLGRPISEAWAELLSWYPWELFCTFTFRDHTHPEAAAKLFRKWLSDTCRFEYGSKRAMSKVVWVRGLEYQKREVIHYHALIYSLATPSAVHWHRIKANDRWLELSGGFARVFKCLKQGEAAAYVAKYVGKGGDVDLSDSYGAGVQTSL